MLRILRRTKKLTAALSQFMKASHDSGNSSITSLEALRILGLFCKHYLQQGLIGVLCFHDSCFPRMKCLVRQRYADDANGLIWTTLAIRLIELAIFQQFDLCPLP